MFKAARNSGFSVAVFAPGWTTECFPDSHECISNHDKLFRSMARTLYAHRIDRPFQTQFSMGICDSKFDPSKRSIFPHLLESKDFELRSDGLIIKGEIRSTHM